MMSRVCKSFNETPSERGAFIKASFYRRRKVRHFSTSLVYNFFVQENLLPTANELPLSRDKSVLNRTHNGKLGEKSFILLVVSEN